MGRALVKVMPSFLLPLQLSCGVSTGSAVG